MSAIVTGSDSGIGRACAVALACRGHDVGITYSRDEEGAHATAEEVGSHDRRAVVRQLDLTRSADVQPAIAALAGELGGLDVLVNNAGVQPDGRALDVALDDFDLTFAVNVRAPMLLMQEACRYWIGLGTWGSIVNVASANAFQNESPESVYNASKAALVALTNAFAHELGHHGIRANCVAPGETITPEAEAGLAADPQEREQVRRYLGKIPLRRAGVPRDQAMAVLFLASDDAAFVTAQTLIVDGGEVGGGSWFDEADAPPIPPPEAPLTG
jgi:NAD(P)-dependent dehydrogenase (short-subunit alcohol dehydrogenase family)